MPAHHLTRPSPDPLTDAVLTVLAGTQLTRVADTHQLHPEDLADAVERYHTAGLAALHQQTEQQWHHVRVRFPDWEQAETITAHHLAPRLDQLCPAGSSEEWWFLRKRPYWRLRIRADVPRTALTGLLDECVAAGTLAAWHPGIYEPETAAFGGETGLAIAHDLFCADSHHLLAHARQHPHANDRRELALLLTTVLQHAAGLDSFERGDVYHRITQLRPAPAPAHTHRIHDLAARIRPLLTTALNRDRIATIAAELPADTDAWLTTHHRAGERLRAAADDHQLARGLRATAAHLSIFGWNRLGLPATLQGVLAHAGRSACLRSD